MLARYFNAFQESVAQRHETPLPVIRPLCAVVILGTLAYIALALVLIPSNEPPTTISIILEESAKLFYGSFLAIGTFAGFLGTIWKHVPATDDA